jgi:multisubunit Na+/H+ antiporter MnhG subunit
LKHESDTHAGEGAHNRKLVMHVTRDTTTQNEDGRMTDPGPSHGIDTVSRTIERIAGLLRWMVRKLATLGATSTLSAIIICLLVWERTSPVQQVDAIALIVLATLLLTPGAVLLLYAVALREVLLIPQRIRSLASDTSERRADLTRASHDLQARPGVRTIWSAMRTVTRVRGDIVAYVPVVKVFNPLFSILALLAIPAAVVVSILAVLSIGLWLIRL